MVIFLYGPDSYRRAQRVGVLKKAFQEKFDAHGHTITTLDGADFDINTFHTHTRSGGLFSTKRFILLQNVWTLNKENQEQLKDALEHVSEDTILCISADSPPRKDNGLFKALLQSQTVEEYGDLDHSGLRTYITQECKKRNATIDSAAMATLITEIGNDLWRMHTILNTLAHYDKNITKQTVSLFLDESLNDNIFDLIDALATKNTARALQLLEEQFLLGSNAQYLITMIAKHIHTLLLVKTNNGEELPIHPYVLKKAQQQSKQFTTETLHALHKELLRIDEQLKTSSIDPRVLLDQFIVHASQQ